MRWAIAPSYPCCVTAAVGSAAALGRGTILRNRSVIIRLVLKAADQIDRRVAIEGDADDAVDDAARRLRPQAAQLRAQAAGLRDDVARLGAFVDQLFGRLTQFVGPGRGDLTEP